MKRKDKKEKYTQLRSDTHELMKKFDLEMRMARKQPKIYYSQEGVVQNMK